MEDRLSEGERQTLLNLARGALELALSGKKLEPLNLDDLPSALRKPGATFVTLTRGGELRGCIGVLEPMMPLAEDVRAHAIAAATQDYRFPPVTLKELPEISIEISRLTIPQELPYQSTADLLARLRPHVDGVILRDGLHRATFLPQVWEKLPDAEEFLSHLCFKMGMPPDYWRQRKLQVEVYQVEEFHE